jgi:aryl-alcohol dehydrogenase-like predicted oxidoreductase
VGLQFAALARAAGHDPAQLAYLWVKDQPGVTAPIIGPRSMAQLQQALPVADMQLTDEMRQACDALVAPGSVVASFFNSAAWMKWKIA